MALCGKWLGESALCLQHVEDASPSAPLGTRPECNRGTSGHGSARYRFWRRASSFSKRNLPRWGKSSGAADIGCSRQWSLAILRRLPARAKILGICSRGMCSLSGGLVRGGLIFALVRELLHGCYKLLDKARLKLLAGFFSQDLAGLIGGHGPIIAPA